jgi:AMP phosphorylase
MKRELKARCFDVSTGSYGIILVNTKDADDLDIFALDRLELKTKRGGETTGIVDLTDTMVEKGKIGIFKEVRKELKVNDGDVVQVRPKDKPDSLKYIKKKMSGARLSELEINEIINDLMEEKLTDVELTAFITSVDIRGINMDETIYLTNAIVNSGSVLKFGGKHIIDKHCIGGVPGNRTTMLIVPVIAAAGLMIPKTSSRAITSPAGTADTMEVLAPVELSTGEIVKVVNKANGCIVWGGAVNLAAADDKLIRIRHPLRLDPSGMMLASILAKKKAVDATDVLVDIPVGLGAKIERRDMAEKLAEQFRELGNSMGMNVDCIVTDGDHPVGNAVGPALEAREALKALAGENVSPELTRKSLEMAGIMLELGGKAPRGNGFDTAKSILDSGKAMKKMKQIIGLQGGDPKIKPDDITVGPKTMVVESDQVGRIVHMDNKGIAAVARGAGAPKTGGAGLYLHVEEGDKIKKGQPLFTLYARSENKLDQALETYRELQPLQTGKIILEKYM